MLITGIIIILNILECHLLQILQTLLTQPQTSSNTREVQQDEPNWPETAKHLIMLLRSISICYKFVQEIV